jgi:hypothetical protein
VLGPDDTYTQFNLSLERAKKDLGAAVSNLGSTDQGLREKAEATVKAFGEISKAISSTGPDSPPPTPPADASEEQLAIGALASLMPAITKDYANNADKARQQLAGQALAQLDTLAGAIAKASKQTGNRVA